MSGFILNSFTKGSGLIAEHIQGGAAVVAYRVVYVDATGRWVTADADALATMPVVGLATEALRVGQYGRVLLQGFASLNTWTWTPGALLYASTTAGELTETAPIGAGDVVQEIGIAFSATQIYFDGAGLGSGGAGGSSNTLEGETAFVGFDATKAGFVNYFVADGVADDVTINAAEAYVTALGGGTIMLEEGTYVLADPIIPTGIDVWYKGQGNETFIDGDGLATTEHAFHITGLIDIAITDMMIQTENGGAKTCHCIFIEDGSNRFYIERVLFLASDDDAIHIEGTNIVGGSIINCEVIQADGEGIFVAMDGGNLAALLKIKDNTIANCGANGMSLTDVQRSQIEGNIVVDSVVVGISLDTCVDNAVIDNVVTGSQSHGLLATDCLTNTMSGNISQGNGSHGIRLIGSTVNAVSGNTSTENTLNGMDISAAANDNTISGNVCQDNVGHGLKIDDSNENTITGNVCNDNDSGASASFDGINITDISIDNLIQGNTCNGNGNYGINIDDVRSVRSWVKNNQLRGNTTGAFLDATANNTKLATLSLPFVDGTLMLSTAPFGWEIDANTEFAIALGVLPDEVQQVVRWKIYATALSTDADAMRLEIEGYGGSSNLPYNTETVAVADHPSETNNFAANDVIFWLLEAGDDTDIDEMTGRDQIMIKVIHEAAGGSDVETDAVFTMVEVEYV